MQNWLSRRKKPWQVAPSQTQDPQVFLQPEQLQEVIPNALLCSHLGKPPCKKSAVFFNIVQKAFDPPPFRLNIMW